MRFSLHFAPPIELWLLPVLVAVLVCLVVYYFTRLRTDREPRQSDPVTGDICHRTGFYECDCCDHLTWQVAEGQPFSGCPVCKKPAEWTHQPPPGVKLQPDEPMS